MRALVTGGAGFIGSHVVDLLIANDHTVAVLDDLSSGSQANVNSAAMFMPVDVTVLEDTLEAVNAVQPDVMVHLAAQVSVPHSLQDPAFDANVNVIGTLNLLRAAAGLPKPPRFVFISSGGAVYGDALEFPSTESTPPNPATPYGIAKLAAEHYVRLLSPGAWVILRFSNVFGPRQGGSKETGVCAVFTRQAAANQPLTIYGDGTQTRDYVFVSDLAQAVCSAATLGSGEVINIASGVETSCNDLASAVLKAAGSGSVQHLPSRAGDVARSWLSVDKAMEVLGWTPTTTLEQGLVQTLAFAKGETATGG